jgi:hypothetical protein
VTFSNNRCTHTAGATGLTTSPSVVINTWRLSLVGNQVRADFSSIVSFDLSFFVVTVIPPYMTAVGNVTSGTWIVPASYGRKPSPLASFNQINAP